MGLGMIGTSVLDTVLIGMDHMAVPCAVSAQFDSQLDMEANCPGEDEDDH